MDIAFRNWSSRCRALEDLPSPCNSLVQTAPLSRPYSEEPRRTQAQLEFPRVRHEVSPEGVREDRDGCPCEDPSPIRKGSSDFGEAFARAYCPPCRIKSRVTVSTVARANRNAPTGRSARARTRRSSIRLDVPNALALAPPQRAQAHARPRRLSRTRLTRRRKRSSSLARSRCTPRRPTSRPRQRAAHFLPISEAEPRRFAVLGCPQSWEMVGDVPSLK